MIDKLTIIGARAGIKNLLEEWKYARSKEKIPPNTVPIERIWSKVLVDRKLSMSKCGWSNLMIGSANRNNKTPSRKKKIDTKLKKFQPTNQASFSPDASFILKNSGK